MARYFRIPFANGGNRTAIPDPAQGNNSLSYTEGFTSDYELDPAVDPLNSKDIPRNEYNELEFQITDSIRQLQEKAYPHFITSAMNGGTAFSYDRGDRVHQIADGNNYESLANSNTDTPPSASWKQLPDSAPSFPTYVYSTSTGDTPSAGGLRFDTTTIADAHIMRINNTTDTGDVVPFSNSMQVGTRFLVIETSVSTGASASEFTITSRSVSGSTITYGLVGHSGGLSISNGNRVSIAIVGFVAPTTFNNRTTLTATGAGNFLVPDGVNVIRVTCVGGGGGGGGGFYDAGLTSHTGGQGGGSGGVIRALYTVTPNSSVEYVVGAGGAGGAGRAHASSGNAGTNGNSTTFGPNTALLVANGGVGGGGAYNGSSTQSPTTGAGGSAFTDTFNFPFEGHVLDSMIGNFGERGAYSPSSSGGNVAGRGGRPPLSAIETASEIFIGSGGRGGYSTTVDTSSANDAAGGTDGAILIEWYA